MKHFIIIILIVQIILAKQIVLSKEKQESWDIQSARPLVSPSMPLGEYVVEVITPPQLLHSVSIPFEAQLTKLYKANYQTVKKGEVLAELTATSWLKAQKKAISDAIEFKHHGHMAERKSELCKEEIIAKKECLIANAELQADKVRLESSKMLIKSFGADQSMVDTLFRNFVIEPKLPLLSPVKGTLIEVNIQPGDSLQTDQVLFTIVKDGKLWLESDIPQINMKYVKPAQMVKIIYEDKSFDARITQLSPIINRDNQTRHVRFELLNNIKHLLSGLRQSMTIHLPVKTIKIDKSSLVIYKTRPIVFIKNTKGYESVDVKIMAETQGFYYLMYDDRLTDKIVTSNTIVLKTLMDGDND